MRKSVASLCLMMVLAMLASSDANAQRRLNTTRKSRSNRTELTSESKIGIVPMYDTIRGKEASGVVLTGYDKALHSAKESFFIVNNTGRHIRSVNLTVNYYDMEGNQLHSVTEDVACDIPAGESRNISRTGWDRQRSFYYHKNPPYRPRTVATPFDVAGEVNYVLTDNKESTPPSLTPMPASIVMNGGRPFVAGKATAIYVPDKKLAGEIIPRIATTSLSGMDVKKSRPKTGSASPVVLEIDPAVESSEGYVLVSAPEGVTIKASSADGIYYGVVTLGEMLAHSDTIPAMTVEDYPRLEYRGMMIDVSRHFHGMDFLKKQIDVMARLKLNNLHLHLTDAAGWRIEIERYPRLTEFAAWRGDSLWEDWTANGAKYCESTAENAYGGYFTKKQLRELVEYARLRGVTIIPEIEMPGHSAEVMAAYPELSCTHDAYGQEDFCPGNEASFKFIEGVLDEVMEVFPSKMIHIGGDEAAKRSWGDCPLCRERMRAEGLKDVYELHSYLVARVERYLNSHGRSLLGWDEIMEGGLAPNATVMSWRGTDGGIRAAQQGHKAIMTPGGYCYLDSYQDAPATQPKAFGGYLPLSKVYSYDPAPDTLDASARDMILGLQGNLWCEHVPSDSHAEYMLYPRMIAVAEAAWTPQQSRSWNNFYPRALAFNQDLAQRGYNVFDLANEVGNRPEALAPVEHLAKGCKVTYAQPWHKSYPAGGASALVDGIRGGWNYSDMLWQGFEQNGTDERIDLTIDLGLVRDITFVGADFMQITIPDVWMPSRVEIYAGETPETMHELAAIDHEVVDDGGKVSFKNFNWQGQARARYIRLCAKTPRGFLFTDEVVVR